MKYRELGHDEKAKDLQEAAAKIETFEQLDALAHTTKHPYLALKMKRLLGYTNKPSRQTATNLGNTRSPGY